jgi:hypothetical protein
MFDRPDLIVSLPRSQTPPRPEADHHSLKESCRRAYEQSRVLREQSRALQLRSLALQERSRTLIERCLALNAIRPNWLHHDCSPDARPRGGDAVAPPPLAARASKRKAPRRNKLLHKNRWLISVDIVASLGRAGVDCDILIPGGEPWLRRAGYDPACRKH